MCSCSVGVGDVSVRGHQSHVQERSAYGQSVRYLPDRPSYALYQLLLFHKLVKGGLDTDLLGGYNSHPSASRVCCGTTIKTASSYQYHLQRVAIHGQDLPLHGARSLRIEIPAIS